MFEASASPYLVPYDGSFKVAAAATKKPDGAPKKKRAKKQLKAIVGELSELQRMLYAYDKYAILCIFQAMDAAGKDGTIRAVTTGINPAGFQVHSFKQPSAEELDHDFLWRTSIGLPERGRIGVFNRSYYEEVLVVKVHPGILNNQRLPELDNLDDIWASRYESIRNHEKHLAQNGIIILKFWLNVSKDEQKQRFLDRLDDPEKNWKFSKGDVVERTAIWMPGWSNAHNRISGVHSCNPQQSEKCAECSRVQLREERSPAWRWITAKTYAALSILQTPAWCQIPP